MLRFGQALELATNGRNYWIRVVAAAYATLRLWPDSQLWRINVVTVSHGHGRQLCIAVARSSGGLSL